MFPRGIEPVILTYYFFSELCWGKAMVVYTMPQQRKKGESERLRGERDQINFVDLGVDCILDFERSRNQRQSSEFPFRGMNFYDVVSSCLPHKWRSYCEVQRHRTHDPCVVGPHAQPLHHGTTKTANQRQDSGLFLGKWKSSGGFPLPSSPMAFLF